MTEDYRLNVQSIAELPDAIRQILKMFPGERVYALSGELGAGKTTIIKFFCQALRVTDIVTSPSFSIINEYHCENDESVYHFDFYRIKKPEEVMDIGYEEYIYSGYYCFMEWAEKIEELLPAEYVYILINKDGEEENRGILVKKITSNDQ